MTAQFHIYYSLQCPNPSEILSLAVWFGFTLNITKQTKMQRNIDCGAFQAKKYSETTLLIRNTSTEQDRQILLFACLLLAFRNDKCLCLMGPL